MTETRASVLRLLDVTNALLAALECGDFAASERSLRERDVALAILARESVRSPLRPDERAALLRAARAGERAEQGAAAQLAGLASELSELRSARASLPRARAGASRTLARA